MAMSDSLSFTYSFHSLVPFISMRAPMSCRPGKGWNSGYWIHENTLPVCRVQAYWGMWTLYLIIKIEEKSNRIIFSPLQFHIPETFPHFLCRELHAVNLDLLLHFFKDNFPILFRITVRGSVYNTSVPQTRRTAVWCESLLKGAYPYMSSSFACLIS